VEQDRIPIKSCTVRGKRITALDKKNNKWTYDAPTTGEATNMVDAIEDRGYVTREWWTKT